VEDTRPEAGLIEISLVNDGEADLSSRPDIEVRWQHARLVASDGLRDFETTDTGPQSIRFHARTNGVIRPLPPGERQAVGWLRMEGEAEVQIESKRP
jgi:hypothetical protein